MISLGIDGGGSKTRFLLVDETGKELARIETGPSNWSSAGPVVAEHSIAAGIRQLPATPDIVCAGFAGAARAEAAKFYRFTLGQLLPKSEILVETDAFVAYVGALGLNPGVLLIAGTGSIAVGRKQSGDMLRVGGWGPVFGDEGSGYWIGREAVRLALRAHDTGEYPEFVSSVAAALGLATIGDVISSWSLGKIGIPAIASVAVEVFKHYPSEPAGRILKDAATHLRDLIDTAIRGVDAPNCRASFAGSVGNNPVIQRLIGVSFITPAHPPEFGAILWARHATNRQ